MVIDKWHDASVELPTEFGEYLVRLRDGIHAVTDYDPIRCDWENYFKNDVTHWMNIPPDTINGSD